MRNLTKKNGIWIRVLRILLTLAYLATLGFIFYNSLQTGAKSAEQSSKVVDTVQDAVSVVAPQSPIATATGEDYDALHSLIRSMAHFAEFALLGALGIWCALSYTDKKPFVFFPLIGAVAVPLADETLQRFVADRGSEWKDVFVDIAGGMSGIIFALGCVFVGVWVCSWIVSIRNKRKQKE